MKICTAGKKGEGQQELLIALRKCAMALAVFDGKCDMSQPA